MTDIILETSRNLFSNLMSAGVTDLIIYGIGFIGFCILGALLTRKGRKANPGKYLHGTTTGQDHLMGTVVIDGQVRTVTRAGNTTYIN